MLNEFVFNQPVKSEWIDYEEKGGRRGFGEENRRVGLGCGYWEYQCVGRSF